MRKRANRENSDLVVLHLMERPGRWIPVPSVAEEIGLSTELTLSTVYFLAQEYGVVEWTPADRSLGRPTVARFVEAKLADYEAGTYHYRPGRRHDSRWLWPHERALVAS